MTKTLHAKSLKVGVCYYPEHWSSDMWDSDLEMMRHMGITMVRVGEFAWSIFEPKDGEFSFQLFDEFIERAGQFGIGVILGTPTATPPAWLTYKYPEVLNVSLDGIQFQHGLRRHYNYNSPVYQQYCRRIVEKMAKHYGENTHVIGWQIDNELNCEIDVFYSERDHEAFRQWLTVKYGTLDRLNHAWGTVVWSQTYTAWEQVHLTRPNPSHSVNPHQALDEKRFISNSVMRFVENQTEVIRQYAPHQFITTNGIFGHLDTHELTERYLDFISYDSYPNFGMLADDESLRDREWSFNLSVARSVSPNFCVMEQQAGPGGWVNRIEQPTPLPGQLRLWAFQSLAHGADAIVFFRWRTAPFGTEIYWHGIFDYDNQPNRRVAEIGQTINEVSLLADKLAGSLVQADVALLRDYNNDWDGEVDTWHGPYTKKSVKEWFRGLQTSHVPCDVLNLSETTQLADLRRYKVLVYPHPVVLSERVTELLEQFVSAGGILITGCRAGLKDVNGHCRQVSMPGPLKNLFGVQVSDFTRIQGAYEVPNLVWNGDESSSGCIHAVDFNEVLQPTSEDCTVLATYDRNYYSGTPALVQNSFGKGTTYYYGSVFTRELAKKLIELTGLVDTENKLVSTTEEVELEIRRNPLTGDRYVFLLNYSGQPQAVHLHHGCRNALNGELIEGDLVLDGYDVLVCEVPDGGATARG
ncbi:beta-galactosidase [Alicyclobacillus ferrooxydans]|uniref:Beta-galactosidase n=1 Tax=Alicyclobacillus ferrooxydans TaxID=471514 RepID=A0A0P9EXW1_9BACL|nr:beta-galactosidase [Alicyclobacillus ferrooxydans]KPV43967.1 beta-galactosidase [Alicyclobacillus ferrooxydans]